MRELSQSWHDILAAGFKSSTELLAYLELPQALASPGAEHEFVTRVPRDFAARMQKGNPRDPLLLQVLAVDEELLAVAGYEEDPLHEVSSNVRKGLVHKYAGRVLMVVTGMCAVNCRYCFRRHFSYASNNPGRMGWDDALGYIAADESIHEVIFSGGDPLIARDETLAYLIDALQNIAHVTTLRIHTRIPVVLPERVNADLCALIKRSRLRCVVVLHVNHPHELSDSVMDACERLIQVGCHLLNQSVLLAGVNDHVDCLAQLSHRLFACRVLPYYLHALDKIRGAAHFAVPDQKACQLIEQLQHMLPVYLVPRLVREFPNEASKRLLMRQSSFVD